MSIAAAASGARTSGYNSLYLLGLTPTPTYITNQIEVHDDGPLPEAGVVLPGSAGDILLKARKGKIRNGKLVLL